MFLEKLSLCLSVTGESVSREKRGRLQVSIPCTGNSMCKGKATFVELQVTWCGESKGCKQGSGELALEKEARTRLFWAPFTMLHFPSKEHLSDTARLHLRKRPRILTFTINNLESRLLRAWRVRPIGWSNAAGGIFADH